MAKQSHYIPVRAIKVTLWGKMVGAIVPYTPGYYAFEYDRKFLSSSLDIAPLKMPLKNGVGPYVFTEFGHNAFMGLPGVFADSLPDGFGNALINEYMRRNGIAPDMVSSLDRLAYIGNRGMGALCYEPDRNPHGNKPFVLDMRRVVEEARMMLNGKLSSMSGEKALREILRIGVSAGGGKAKAVVGWNRETDQFVTGDRDLPAGFEPWIIKFTPEEYPYRGECEFRVNELAKSCGIKTSECRLYELDGIKHFMTRRFDRGKMGERYHTQTLGAISHLPPEGSAMKCYSYDHLFIAIEELGLGYEAMEEMFARMVFNVYVDESDDHTKNFSFIMDSEGKWSLSPAYDLNGGAPAEAEKAFDPWCGWHDQHAIMINGKQSHITDDDLLVVGDRFAIGTARKLLNRIKRHFLKR